MEQGHRAWPPHAGAHADQGQPGRPGANYGPGTPQQHTSQLSPHAGSALPPPPPTSAPFPPFHQASHSLANLAGLSQSSPRQQTRPDGPPHPQQGPGLPLPGFSQATGQPGAAERERERAREEAQIRIKEEQDRHHHEHERQRQELPPQHQTPQGPPVHLHQPVAVGPRSVHGPNGLLGNAGGQSQQGLQFGAPGGPGSLFAGGPVQPAASGSQQMQPGLQVPYPGAQVQGAQQQQMGQGQAPGQQPILNDALSYLDQVKVQFADHPDVYNRFLDIMKDFKSGAIDTPGVIGRVSTLFAGNPDLIQGFNTFLPPGYRIECGAGDDPNAIRVTTPMGTTVQSMPQPRPLSRQDGDGKFRPANGTYTPQPGQAAHILLSPNARAAVPGSAQSHAASLEAARQQEHQALMHQQEQRGVNQLQSAVSAAAGARAGLSPAPGRTTPLPGGQDPNGMGGAAGQQDPAGMEKRGPVEFNHAISYVNKIKNRFSAHPDIYKQFLEILQTYQRESKPIQDVYSQVTHLFKTAPDLLEDFKQFLPESAAQAKAAAAARQQAEESVMLSNVRNEAPGPYGSPVISREGAHIGTPNHGRGLPPVGNFAPTPVTKDNNKRKRGERQGTVDTAQGAVATSTAKGAPFAPQPGKRAKQTHPATGKQPTDQQPPASPTLVPALPSPIPPTTTTSAATNEELIFFDRAKKAIGNKNTMNEFLKLCNLFSNDLIDRSTLVHRARSFIGGNPDLLKWFSDFVGLDERDVVIENKARVPTGRISLSNCRGLGPSYRLLPKREMKSFVDGNAIPSRTTRSGTQKDQSDDTLPPFSWQVKFPPKANNKAKGHSRKSDPPLQPQQPSPKELAELPLQEKDPPSILLHCQESFVRSDPLPGGLDALLGNGLAKHFGPVSLRFPRARSVRKSAVVKAPRERAAYSTGVDEAASATSSESELAASSGHATKRKVESVTPSSLDSSPPPAKRARKEPPTAAKKRKDSLLSQEDYPGQETPQKKLGVRNSPPQGAFWNMTTNAVCVDTSYFFLSNEIARLRSSIEPAANRLLAHLQERQRPCSGRDELCNSVLNDDWASHPTWASEDSGFIAHRKNTYEEALHRIEEERHDYDFNIETCSRTIQLLEPIAQTLRRMPDAEQRSYKLPPGLGGQSETIYKRVIMKLYGREKGREVIDRLHELPYQVIPVLLNRLKERLETWKMAQREWEKVWRDQTQKMFWKSLDHQAITARANDKRQFQVKTLQTEIQVKYEEMRRQNNTYPGTLNRPQMEFAYDNVEVLVDAAYLVLVYVEMNLSAEQPTLANFIKEFVPLFFGLDGDEFRHQMRARLGETPPNEPLDESASGAEDSVSSKGRKAKTSLLRSTLDRGRGKLGRSQREDSQASASRATTPDVTSNADDDMQLDSAADGDVKAEPEVTRWFKYPDAAATNRKVVRDADPDEPQRRDVYRLWGNTPMYCFIRVFTYLYERLLALKKSEASAAEAIKHGLRKKPANDLGIADRSPTEFFADLTPSANYYNQMIQKFEEVLKQVYDLSEVEDALRRYYMHVGYQLYGFEKMVGAISKFANSILTSETKDRSWDIYQLFKKDRRNEMTTAQQQTDYRKAAEKLIKEAEGYKIEYDQSKARVGIYLTRKDEPNYDDGLSPLDQENRWRYYIASYTSTETTDGIQLKDVDIPFLIRNVHAAGADPTSKAFPPSPFAKGDSDNEALQQRIMDRITTEQSEERLEIRIAVNNYKIVFAPGTAAAAAATAAGENDAKYEVWIARMPERQGGEEGVKEAEDCREFDEDEAKERFVMINAAMRGLRKEDVEGRNEGFTKGIAEGFDREAGAAGTDAAATAAAAEGKPEDEDMEVD